MATTRTKSQPTWTDVKTKLADLDRKALLALVQDLYAANKENQVFLHTRFGVGPDPLEPYKQTIDRWVSPDVFRRQNTSIAKAKQAIVDYKRAVGDPAGVAELMVFYCERSAGFSTDVGPGDGSDVTALARMFEKALDVANTLPAAMRDPLIARLEQVHAISCNFGYGAGDDIDSAFARHAMRRK